MDYKINTNTVSKERLFPRAGYRKKGCVPLSILDNTVARFAPTAAIWLYDAEHDESFPSWPETFKASFQKTLNAYHQWAGQLRWTTYEPNGGLYHRAERLELTFGNKSDPGVEFVSSTCSEPIASMIPASADRAKGSKCWIADQFPTSSLFPDTLLALNTIDNYLGLPNMIVQITSFQCGGVAIAVKITHPLADAQSLMCFMNDWAAMNRIIDLEAPASAPIFDPSLLDKYAGDVDSSEANTELVKIARSLPLNRHDYWYSGAGAPTWAIQPTQPPSELSNATIEKVGKSMPWSEWDTTAPVTHVLFHFTTDEINRVWEAAANPTTSTTSASQTYISRMDALLAHLFLAINRARLSALPHSDIPIHLNLSLGIRPRVAPPLPTNFLGSPIQLCAFSLLPSQILSSDPLSKPLSLTANLIRATMNEFTPSATAALLHELAFQLSPQRLWDAFLGTRNVLVTSWVNLGLYDLDFVGKADGPKLRYAEGVIQPFCDGVLQVQEANPIGSQGGAGRGGEGKKKKNWYDHGVDVSVYLEKAAMERLLRDEGFRMYDH